MDFTVTITDQAALDGIAWARRQHNDDALAMAQPPAEEGGEPVYAPGMPVTPDDAAYVQWVMERASVSYAEQKARADALAAADAAAAA